jgi:AbrB family looped-hinge helix DNA binding protein
MKELVCTITQRGQVTIPAEVRQLLGLKAKDKVAFEIDNNQVRLVPAKFTLESAYGSVKPLRRPEDFKEILRAAKEEHVKKTVPKM